MEAAESKYARNNGDGGGSGGGGGGGNTGGNTGGSSGNTNTTPPHFILSELETSIHTPTADEFDSQHIGGTLTFTNPHLSVDSTKYPDSEYTKPQVWITNFSVVNKNRISISTPYQIVDKQSNESFVPEKMENLSFTLSFEATEETETTSSIYQSSYADITLGNLRTYSGDVHRAKVYAKRQNQNSGLYQKIGDFLLQPHNELVDSASVSGQRPIGFFFTQSQLDNYWESSSATTTVTLDNTYLMPGISISGSNEGQNQSYELRTKSDFVFRKREDYQILFDLHYEKTDKSGSYLNNDGNVEFRVEPHADIEVFFSGSLESGDADVEYSLGRLSSFVNSDYYSDKLSESSGSLQRVFNIFRTHGVEGHIVSGSLGFRIHSGRFHLANIVVSPFNDEHFNPGFVKAQFPLGRFEQQNVRFDFLTEFYDYNNNKAVQVAATSESVLFQGPRNVISTTDDDIWDGTTVIGKSMLLHGSNPAFLSSIGYNGFDKTRAGTGTANGGLLIWSGSIGSGAPVNYLTASEDYNGVGLEIIDASAGSGNPYQHRFLQFASNKGGESFFKVQTNQFLLGVSGSGGAESYISSSGDVLSISSSNFFLNGDDGSVTMQGTITATAGGQIGGFTITDKAISTTDFFLSGSTYSGTGFDKTNLVLSSSGFQINSNGSFKATTGEIGSFSVDPTTISSSNNALIMHSDGRITGSTVDFTGGKIGSFNIGETADATPKGVLFSDSNELVITGSSGQITGSQVLFTGGKIGGLSIDEKGVFIGTSYRISSSTDALDPVAFISSSDFKVGAGGQITASSGLIGGFTITDSFISGGNLILNSNGTIESADFSSGVIAGSGNGFRLTAGTDVLPSYLEVEKARIRGTLSTAVFEKESVNAVGGMLMVANSTVLSQSVSATDTTMSVDNASGFTGSYNGFTGNTLSDISAVDGEVLLIKKVSDTGFSTEYVLVQSASFRDPSAAAAGTDPSGYLYVTRSFGGAQLGSGENPTTESFQADGGATSYTEGQVIASTGKIGTGYIFMNANPNDPFAPYMDIVERTGSKVYEMDLKVRVGDLTGLSQTRLLGTNPNDAGFGMYAKNVFLEGGITANTGSIAGIKMDANKLYAGAGNYGQTDTPFFLSGDSGATAGDFSLKDAFVWDSSAGTLTIKGAIRQTSAGVGITDLVNKGTWAASTAYVSGSDLVSYESSGITSTYICKNSHTSTNDSDTTTGNPAAATNSWNIFAQGSAGADGSSAATLNISSNTQVFSFDDSSDTTPTPSTATITVNQQNQASNLVTGDITVTNGTKSSFSYSGTSGTGTATVTITPSGTYPVTVSVSNDGLSDSLQIPKVQGGTDGTDGVDAITIVNTNPTHTLPANSSGVVSSYSDSGTTIQVYEGTTQLDYDGSGTTAGHFTIATSQSPSSTITIGTISDSVNDAVVGNHSAMVNGTDNVVITYTITGQRLDGTSLGTITTTQSIGKNKSGADGSSAKIVTLAASQYAVLYDGAGNKTAVAITLTATPQNTTSTQYRFLENGVERQAFSTTATYTIPDGQEPAEDTADTWAVEIREGSSGTAIASDAVSIYGIGAGADGQDGDDAYTVILTNESVTLPADNSGTVSSYALSGTDIIAYKGTTELDGVTLAGNLTTNKFSASVSSTSNITADTTFTSAGNPLVYGDASNMTADNASITYLISLEGTGTQFEKVQTFTKAKAGGDGADGGAGPGVVFRGTYDAAATYFSSSIRRDVVVYSSNYYLSKVNNTTAGTPGGGDWESFGGQFTSVATDILLAQDATITNGLVIGDGSNDGFIRSYDATSETAGAGFFMIDDHSTGTAKFRVGTATNANPPNYMYFNGSSLDIQSTSFNLVATSSNAGIIIDSTNSTLLVTGSNASTDGNSVLLDGGDGIIQVKQDGLVTFETGDVKTYNTSAPVIIKSIPIPVVTASAAVAYVSMSDAIAYNNFETRRLMIEHGTGDTFFRQDITDVDATQSYHIVDANDINARGPFDTDTPGAATNAFLKRITYGSGWNGANSYLGPHTVFSSRHINDTNQARFVGAGGTGSAEYVFQTKIESGSGGWANGNHALMRLETDFSGMVSAHKNDFVLLEGRTITSSNQVRTVFQVQDDGAVVSRGNITAFGTTFASVSDERLKENIYELTGSMNKIFDLRPTHFTWKENQKQDVGFIAQEVEKVIPEVVETSKGMIEEGKENIDIKTISYTKLIPYLVDTIQQMNKRIKELEKKVK